MLFGMDESEFQRPEGLLIDTARLALRPKLSGNRAARLMGLSPTRWHQIIKGFQWVGAGVAAPVVGPADTVAHMALVVGVTADQLAAAGRQDAADVLEVMRLERVEFSSDPLDALIGIRDQLTALINDMRR